jgi:vacuolar-type H+-ATPase subunit E/Vma4
LQYTDANTQHFEEWYRPRLVGGFHASTQDGNLRVDYTQHALSALATYLEDLGG